MNDKSRWREKALCATEDPDLFDVDPKDAAGVALARSVCLHCPVKPQCLEDALELDAMAMHRWNVIRAGLTPLERRAILKKRNRAMGRRPGAVPIVRRSA